MSYIMDKPRVSGACAPTSAEIKEARQDYESLSLLIGTFSLGAGQRHLLWQEREVLSRTMGPYLFGDVS